MSSGFDTRLIPGSDLTALHPARADEPKADPPYSAYPQIGIVTGEPDRLDARAVEHTRQSRLQRWQRLPDTAK